MTIKNFYKDDYGFDIHFALKDKNGDAVDLTNVTSVAFKLMKKNGTVVKVSGTCSITNPSTLGTCFYSVGSGDFDEVGEYEYQIQIAEAGSITTCKAQETINILRKF